MYRHTDLLIFEKQQNVKAKQKLMKKLGWNILGWDKYDFLYYFDFWPFTWLKKANSKIEDKQK